MLYGVIILKCVVCMVLKACGADVNTRNYMLCTTQGCHEEGDPQEDGHRRRWP